MHHFLYIITLVASSYLTYFFASRSKREESILKYKEEQYKSWIYGSGEVIEAINEMVKSVIDSRGNAPDPRQGRKVVGNIVLAMRKDLNGKTKSIKY